MTPDLPAPLPPRTATRGLAARLRVPGQPDVRLPALLRYAATDPYAVRLVLLFGDLEGPDASDASGPDSVEWLFARSLLTAGLVAPTGEGDVRVRVEDRVVQVDLAGQASVLLPLDALVEFLAASYTVVPTGSEQEVARGEVERELSRLLE